MSATTETTPAVAATSTESPAPEVEGHRVYVGNLAFNATEEQVREHFTNVGEIVQVLLPTRYKSRRPAGYAFVSFKNEADAKKAVDTLNESEIGERKISLELARSKEENAERRQDNQEKRRQAHADKPKAEGEASDEASDKAKSKKKKAASKTGRRRGPEDGDETAVDAEEGDTPKAKSKKSKAKGPKDTKEPKEARIDGAEGDKAEKKEPKERKPRLALTGEESKNTVFVANLPFNIEDEALSNLFTELSIKVKTAHVIRGLRRLPGRRPFRGSKGFGFVELEDPSQQQEAVEKVNGSTVGDRKITAKVAQEMKAIEEIEAMKEAEASSA